MTRTVVVGRLDALLGPLGFARRGMVWNRRVEVVVEVIDMQVSKSGDTATLNAGVLDRDVHLRLWGGELPARAGVADCTVSARMGELMDGRDLWWELGDERFADEAVRVVADHLLPFVTSLHSREAMVQWLTDSQVERYKYPLPIINLAILQHLLGRSAEGCELLAEVQSKARGGWRLRAADIAERLGCSR